MHTKVTICHLIVSHFSSKMGIFKGIEMKDTLLPTTIGQNKDQIKGKGLHCIWCLFLYQTETMNPNTWIGFYPTSHFWVTSCVALPIMPLEHTFSQLLCSVLKNGSLEFKFNAYLWFCESTMYENKHQMCWRLFHVFGPIEKWVFHIDVTWWIFFTLIKW